jgi:hypothetical protein
MRLFREHMPPKLRRQVDEMYASSSDEEGSEGEGEAEEDSSPGGCRRSNLSPLAWSWPGVSATGWIGSMLRRRMPTI